jgi:hypothetical protein
VSLIKLNVWEDIWHVAIEILPKKKEENKVGSKKKSDSIYGQYTNVCKLGANWDH